MTRWLLIGFVCAWQYVVGQDSLFTIPVVVHVVYTKDVQNISDERIQSQIEALNRDFRLQNEDISKVESRFMSFTADTKISFKLTNKNPAGESSSGITRTKTSHAVFGNADIHYTAKGGQDAWDPTKYFNIWVADLSPTFLGWASNPSIIDEEDGIVIDYVVFGENSSEVKYNKARTAVHETGHWLGLSHPEGLGNCDSDDGIDDTPLQASSYSSCQKDAKSCDSYDMVQNFMQSNADSCLLFFTKGQAEKMQTVLKTERKILAENARHLVGFATQNRLDEIAVSQSFGEEILNINSQNKPISVVLIDLNGSQFYHEERKINPVISTKNLRAGLYILHVQSENLALSKKIFVQK